MYRPIVPCPSCQRHVLATEAVCPFCAAALPADLSDAIVPGASQRLTRAAAFVFTASLTVAGCGADVTESGTTGGGTTGGTTSGASGAGGADAGPDDDGGNVALYGDPAPIDGGADDGGPDDDGGGQAEYGAPPDAG